MRAARFVDTGLNLADIELGVKLSWESGSLEGSDSGFESCHPTNPLETANSG